MRTTAAIFALGVSVCPATAVALQYPEFAEPECCRDTTSLGVPMAEVIGNNLILFVYHRYVAREPWYDIGFDTWGTNLTKGPEWDTNHFMVNQFSHPYHGGLYFTSARAHGHSFWASTVVTFFGSWMWEYLMEELRPAANDLINTTVGGAAIGEASFRLSTAFVEEAPFGAPWSAIAGFLVNPIGGAHALLTGDVPRSRRPQRAAPIPWEQTLDFGYRWLREGRRSGEPESHPFLALSLRYGDPFSAEDRKPFDAFELSGQVNLRSTEPLGRFHITGLLAAKDLHRSASSQHLVGVFQHMDFLNDQAYEFGAQTASAGLRSRFRLADAADLRTSFDVGPVLLGAVYSEHHRKLRRGGLRDYDFGSGVSVKLGAAALRSGRALLSVGYSGFWVHTVHGAASNHLMHMLKIGLRAPVFRSFAFGFDYEVYKRSSFFTEYADIHRSNVHLRTYVSGSLR